MRRFTFVLASLAVALFAATRREKVGVWRGIPYDWRWPRPAVIRERFWNPSNARIFTPKVFGWGWSINLAALLPRLGG
ncbi:MAG: DUF5808 domain-containing protein [Chloroflexota bacterium]